MHIFLQSVEGPYYCIINDVTTETAFSGGGKVRDANIDEALELFEGPREDILQDVRARVKCSNDDASAWLTIKDCSGEDVAMTADMHVIASSMAMTDEKDVQDSMALRMLTEGELLQCSSEPEEDWGILRFKCKTVKYDDGPGRA